MLFMPGRRETEKKFSVDVKQLERKIYIYVYVLSSTDAAGIIDVFTWSACDRARAQKGCCSANKGGGAGGKCETVCDDASNGRTRSTRSSMRSSNT